MCNDDTKTALSQVLPFPVDPFVLEEIVHGSCTIPFRGIGESLFKPGDPPKGFYWILAGTAEVKLPTGPPLSIRAGEMAGLDNFLLHQPHTFPIATADAEVKTLFVNPVAYRNFSENQDFRKLINKQILRYLGVFKSRLASLSTAASADLRR